MASSLIVIGNEILAGFTLDTNSFWLCQRLRLLGHGVSRITTVADTVDAIAGALRQALSSECEVVFVCGGLGPTPDDVTYQGVASGLGVPLVEYADVLEEMRKRYEEYLAQGFITSYEITGGVRKMAVLPRGSLPLKNSVGAAPGLFIEAGMKKIFVLPGVPQELKSIFTEEIEGKLLDERQHPHVEEITVHAGESRLFDILSALDSRFFGVSVGSYPHLTKREVTLRLMGKREEVEEAREELMKGLREAGLD